MKKSDRTKPRHASRKIVWELRSKDSAVLEINGCFESSIAYNRENGKQPKNVCTTYSKSLYEHPDFVISEFENIFSIDSNTRKISDANVTIGILIQWDIKINGENPSKVSYRLLGFMGQICVNVPSAKVENMMWGIMLNELKARGELYEAKKTLLVVDSDKDELIKYNSGEIFTIDCAYNRLPREFKFAYASAEKSDSVFNTIIKWSDSIATYAFTELSKNEGCYGNAEEIVKAFNRIALNNYVLERIKDRQKP